jgi:hypothetical protein
MERIPEDADLSATIINKRFLPTLLKQLARTRDRVDVGHYGKLPVGHDQVIVFSDAEIGESIDRDEIRETLDWCESEYGQLTTSKAWWPEKKPRDERSEWSRNGGIIRASFQWVDANIAQMGLEEYRRTHRSQFFTCSFEEYQRMVAVAGLQSDAQYWAEIREYRGAHLDFATWLEASG